jgi:MFS family permease
VQGLTPIESGLTGLPLSLATFVTSAGIGRRLHNAPPGTVIAVGLLSIGAGGLVGALFVHGGASWPALLPGYALIGVGVGLAIPISNAAAMDQVPPHRRGMAGGSVRTMQQLGYAFGIALLGTVFAARARHVVAGDGVPDVAGVAHAVAGGQAPGLLAAAPPESRAALDATVHAAAVSGLQSVLAVSGILGVVAGLAVLALMRSVPAPQHEETVARPAPGPSALPAAEGPVLIKL